MRYLLLACVLLVGCQPEPTPDIAPEFRDEVSQADGMRRAALTFAFLGNSQPQPSPNPPGPTPPNPGEKCERCNGTGRIKPDGRIEVDCFDCGGDGILMPADREPSLWEARIKLATAVIQATKAETATATAKAACCDCPNCTCGTAGAGPCPCNCAECKAHLAAPGIVESSQRLNWHTDRATAQAESQRTGKQAIVYWYSPVDCPNCELLEQRIFANARVQAALANYVLMKVDATTVDARWLSDWKVTTIPDLRVVSSDWTRARRMEASLDVDEFIDRLTSASQVSSSTTLSTTPVQGNITYFNDQAPAQSAITYVQGSTGGYSYGAPVMSYGSAGGAMSYGSGGGAVSYYQPTYSRPMYAPQYSAPRYYTQPSYQPSYYAPSYSSGWFGGGYSGGGRVVCGPNGCFVQ